MKNCFKIAVIATLLMSLFGCQNNILSSNSVPFMNSDSAIIDSVRATFANNNQLAGIPIEIQSTNGIVELSGYVKTIRQSDTALELATKVPGVKGVQNNLIVRK
ncbi:BON domain-containing protein [Legionella gresilensis]|uniref:BON domain-containing protein n=1 Tax=Legionella gresilensis TaxID=91823 RepID=UPI001041937B|nr:BON domain-containing protein [Legionella gresilensis]